MSASSEQSWSTLNLPTRADIQAERLRRNTELANLRTRRNADRIRAKCKSLSGFVREAWPILEPNTAYVHNWHIDLICAHLEAITFGRLLELGLENRLLINEPAGMMKSLIVSVMWEAWEWGPCNMPWLRYLTTSYSDDYVKRDSRKTRDLILSDWYQLLWGDRVQLVRAGETSFANSATGTREGMPFVSLTSGRGDRLLIDDPHSTEGAESDADRAKAIRIMRESVPSRVNNPAQSAIVIIHHRLHQGDVSGFILETKQSFINIMLPMRFEKDRAFISPLGDDYGDPRTTDGELMFPERFPEAVLDRDRKMMTAYAEAGQWQQRPSSREGIMFKRGWFPMVKAPPAFARRVRGYDLAATEQKKKDTTTGPAFTAGVKLSRASDGVFYIESVVRTRSAGRDVRTLIQNTAQQDGKACEIDLPQDPGQAGKTQAQDMIAILAGFKAFASPETGDKITRAEPVAAQAEAGNIKVVEGAWNEEFFTELELFPGGKYKDQVDALSRAFARLIRNRGGGLHGPIVVTAGARNIPGQ